MAGSGGSHSGEMEMEALALGVLRVLNGIETGKEYMPGRLSAEWSKDEKLQ